MSQAHNFHPTAPVIRPMDPPGLQAHSRGIFSLIVCHTVCQLQQKMNKFPLFFAAYSKAEADRNIFNLSKGRVTLPNRINFWKNSKRPLIPPLIFGKLYCIFLEIVQKSP